MGKAGKWIRNFLTGKKAKDKGGDISNDDSSLSIEILHTPVPVPPNTPKEKSRWSFRRSGSGNKDANSMDSMAIIPSFKTHPILQSQKYKKQHSTRNVTLTTGTNVAVTNTPASAVGINSASRRRSSALQDVAATMIQAVFRSYLARRALCALKGLVKLQALVRGHLVRKQAISTLRRMQALVNVQVRTRAERLLMTEKAQLLCQRSSNYRPSNYSMDRHLEESIKHVQIDRSESSTNMRRRNSYSPAFPDISAKSYFYEDSISTEQSSPNYYSAVSKQDMMRVTCYSPQLYEKTFYPNYMANTESFRAKARSQSAPKQRLDLLERQPRKKVSVEERNVHRAIRMQQSSSQAGSAGQQHQFQWSNKIDSSVISPKDSECDSTSTVITRTNYCRPLDTYEVSNY